VYSTTEIHKTWKRKWDEGNTLNLKGVLQEIFDLRFFRESVGTEDYALSRIFIDSVTTAINLSPVTMTPAINLSLVLTTPTKKAVGRALVCLDLEIKILENSFCKLNAKGLIYTENKTLGRLCKMFNPFFYEL
jgi:hypothetical protein